MKANRSLKEIFRPHYRIAQQKSPTATPPQITIHSPLHNTTPNLNLDSISKNIVTPNTPTHPNSFKQYKTCHSHKTLHVPSFKINITSPKGYPEPPQTQRHQQKQHKYKNFQNVQVSPFDVNKPDFGKLNVLTPVNRNILNIEEPKRPKILSKQRHSHSFSEEFKLGKVLGKGRFGNVFKAQHNATGFVCAVKQISLAQMSNKLAQRLTWEMKIQSFLRHEHCLQLYKYYREGNSLYLVVELGECSLFDKLREKRYFTEVETCYYVTQTIKALMNLHQYGVIHRDLKPENIVLVNNIVKLADFGWAIHIGKTEKRKTFCGTLDYVSPQIVQGKEYDQMVDVWSVGVLCYELCTGHAPFESSKSRQDTYRKILSVELKFPKYLSQGIKDFIKRLLTREPAKRMSLEEAMTHPWVKKYFMK